jgi:twitching motility protein PilJ
LAGEHGRGVAVVAAEVRALAERSASATDKIDELIRLIQTDTNAAMVAMERSTQEVVAGSRLADKAGETLAAIGAVTERVVELSSSIEELVRRQVSAADYLQATVGDVATTTANSLEDVRAVAIGMQTLEALSASLRESVSVFRVETDQPEAPESEASEAAAAEAAAAEAAAPEDDLVTTPEAA